MNVYLHLEDTEDEGLSTHQAEQQIIIRSPTCSEPYGDYCTGTKLPKVGETKDSVFQHRWYKYYAQKLKNHTLYPGASLLWGEDTWLFVASGGGALATVTPYKVEPRVTVTVTAPPNCPDGWLLLPYPTYLLSSSAASYNIYPRTTLYRAGAPAARSAIYAMTPTCVTSFRWNDAE